MKEERQRVKKEEKWLGYYPSQLTAANGSGPAALPKPAFSRNDTCFTKIFCG